PAGAHHVFSTSQSVLQQSAPSRQGAELLGHRRSTAQRGQRLQLSPFASSKDHSPAMTGMSGRQQTTRQSMFLDSHGFRHRRDRLTDIAANAGRWIDITGVTTEGSM